MIVLTLLLLAEIVFADLSYLNTTTCPRKQIVI